MEDAYDSCRICVVKCLGLSDESMRCCSGLADVTVEMVGPWCSRWSPLRWWGRDCCIMSFVVFVCKIKIELESAVVVVEGGVECIYHGLDGCKMDGKKFEVECKDCSDDRGKLGVGQVVKLNVGYFLEFFDDALIFCCPLLFAGGFFFALPESRLSLSSRLRRGCAE